MCGGKIKCILIAYFLGNICVKNCRNRTVYVKIIASCKGGTFFETQCTVNMKFCCLDLDRLFTEIRQIQAANRKF